ncbi:MAG TPA: DUF2062 domain-containing protein, partial [Tepidisphaeraceae bacterium]|nr:DUF2062 domain-containing protein [Tepidisphaeraceae bacterium]
QLDALGLPIIVINDGSDDDTAGTLGTWADAAKGRFVETHPTNRGKAAALLSGFDCARAHGFTHAVTVDTDLQHDANDVPPLLALSRQHPASLVLGVRPITTDDYPAASRVGRGISNLLVLIECGVRVADSQCGLRVYPLVLMAKVKTTSGRYGFETEIITRAAWAGIDICETDVRCIYDVPQGRVSHFRPVMDSVRAVGTHLRLLARSLLPWPTIKVQQDNPQAGTILEQLLRWLNPAKAWRDIRAGRGDGRFPASVAAGMFMATVPLYGVKTVVCLAIAKVLRLQPLVVLAVSSLNTPPVGPLLAMLSIVTGHALLHQELPSWPQADVLHQLRWNVLGAVAWEWVLGSIVCGTVLAIIAYFAARGFVRLAARDDQVMSGRQSVATAASPATEPAMCRPHS